MFNKSRWPKRSPLAVTHITEMINHVFISFSAVQICDFLIYLLVKTADISVIGVVRLRSRVLISS